MNPWAGNTASVKEDRNRGKQNGCVHLSFLEYVDSYAS